MSFATFWPTHRGLVTGGLRRCLVCGTERVDEQHPTFSAEAAPHATASLLRAGSAWWYALDVDIFAGALDDADCRLFAGTGHVVVDGLAAPSWSALWPHEVVSLEGSRCAGCDHLEVRDRTEDTFGVLASAQAERLQRWVRDRSFAWVGGRDAALPIVTRRAGDRLARLTEEGDVQLAVHEVSLLDRPGADACVLRISTAETQRVQPPWLP